MQTNKEAEQVTLSDLGICCGKNVPGAFSSGTPKGEDFRIVLEEIVRVKCGSVYVPGPYPWPWQSAGRILLGTDFSMAWRCLDAQYWGVAQRRKRIFLVADFAGRTADKILFIPEGMFGILRRASERGKALPPKLERALKIQAGLMCPDGQPTDLNAFHINQRDEGIDLHGVSGALMATTNMQMQTFFSLNRWPSLQTRGMRYGICTMWPPPSAPSPE